MSYATPTEIADVISILVPDYDGAAVKTGLQTLATAEVNGELVKWEIGNLPTRSIGYLFQA